MKQLRLEITTKSPVIITSEDSAQVFLGIIFGMWHFHELPFLIVAV